MGRPGRKISPEARDLGQHLAALRRARGLTQTDLARALGLPQAMVSEYERGVLRLHGQLLVKLARVLRTSADELLGIKPAAGEGDTPSRQFLRRLRQIEGLPRRDQQALLRTIDAFLGNAELKKTA